MNPWTQLLPIQILDTQIRRLDHRLDGLPERTARDEIDERLAELRAVVDRSEAAKHELVRAQKRLDDEVALLQDKISGEEAKLYGEGSTDPGHLQDLQAEITILKRKVNGLEDDELELMERVEPIDAELADLAERKAGLDREAEVANAALAEAEASISAERDTAAAEREALLVPIDSALAERYDKARSRNGGIAVAALEHGTCGACHMKLSAVELDRVHHVVDDAEIQCEDCDRYLVRP